MRHALASLALLSSLLLPSALGCGGCGAPLPDPADAADGAPGEDGGGDPAEDAGSPGDDAGPDDDGGPAVDAGDVDSGPAGDGGPDGDGGTGDGGAGPADAGPPECAEDGDCALGSVCLQGACVEGCDDDRDCPATSPACDPAAPPHGACVQCTEAADCTGAGEVCFENRCRTQCSADAPTCPTPGVCDVDDGVCVRCLESAQCDLGTICRAGDCVPGCEDDRDCPAGTVCDDANQCVEGCTSLPDSCPLGTRCVDTTCVLGCGGDDARCGEGQVCVDDACLASCGPESPCGSGETCLDGVCVDGCQVDEDCGTFTTTPTCDGQPGQPGRCVGCLADDDCPGQALCDEPATTCRLSCNDIGEGGCALAGGVCMSDVDALCVPCLEDGDCREGETCDAITHECLAPPGPPPAICDACSDDADCGGQGAQCVLIQTSSGPTPFFERACGEDCSDDGACPQAFRCAFVEEDGVVRGRQCVPENSVVQHPTCSAYRDLVAQTSCFFSGQCGAAGPDGVCVGATGFPNATAGVCSIPCTPGGTDCPAGTACEPPPDAADAPGTCAVAP